MARCSSCGTDNKDGAFTCFSCGEGLGPATAVPPAIAVNPAGSDGAPHPPAPDMYDPASWQAPFQAYAPSQGMYPQAPEMYQPAPGLYPPFPQLPYPVVMNLPNSGKATASLVLGIVGLLICPLICSGLAIIFGVLARNEIQESGGAIGGLGMARAGLILGVIGMFLGIMWIFFVNSLRF